MKKLIFSSLLTLSSISIASALPAIDAVFGIGYNSLSPSGYLEYGDPNTASSLDLEDDLNLGDSKKAYFYGIIDFPILPALKVEYMPFQFDGTGVVNTSITFGNVTFPTSTRVYTDVNFDQYDISLYYGLPIPFIHPKFGITVKYLDGCVEVRDLNNPLNSEKADITLPIPMVYLGADIRIPLIPKISDIIFDVEGKWVGYDGHSITDLKVLGKVKLLRVPLVGSLFAGVGYKYLRLKLDDLEVDDKTFNSDIKVQGFLGEVGIEF
ncbi:MAG: TIGR04219 family outer membrane beta-barrel protein [Aquificae bacterium]|nr:TIGR04219 family outer membrane beta-barrel protein [Aquificota bacterium]